jgi:hypothetical protein
MPISHNSGYTCGKTIALLSSFVLSTSWPVNLVACILQCSAACNCPVSGFSLRINQQIWLDYLTKYCLLSASIFILKIRQPDYEGIQFTQVYFFVV